MSEYSVTTDISGRICALAAGPGDRVAADDPVVMVESMKVEVPIVAPMAGTVARLLVAEGDMVEEGQELAVLET